MVYLDLWGRPGEDKAHANSCLAEVSGQLFVSFGETSEYFGHETAFTKSGGNL
jgi:hypothetical protein